MHLFGRNKKEQEKQEKEITQGACLSCTAIPEGTKPHYDDVCSRGYLVAEYKPLGCKGYNERKITDKSK
jgi:hypothetical protein